LFRNTAATRDKGVYGGRAVYSRNAHRRVLLSDEAVVNVSARVFNIPTMTFPDGATWEEADPLREVDKFVRALESFNLELLLRLNP